MRRVVVAAGCIFLLSCVYIKAEECYAEQTSVAIACDTVDYTKGLSVWFDTPNDL